MAVDSPWCARHHGQLLRLCAESHCSWYQGISLSCTRFSFWWWRLLTLFLPFPDRKTGWINLLLECLMFSRSVRGVSSFVHRVRISDVLGSVEFMLTVLVGDWCGQIIHMLIYQRLRMSFRTASKCRVWSIRGYDVYFVGLFEIEMVRWWDVDTLDCTGQ